jgi:hypothetical protein
MKSDIRIYSEGEKKKLSPQSVLKGEILNFEKSERDDSEGEKSLKMIPKVKHQSREIPSR